VGEKRAVQNVLSAIEDALRSSSIEPGRIESWGLGLAGAISETEQAQWRAALRAANQSTLSAAMVAIDEDVVAAQKGAFGGEAGAVCIAGTGANCFGINERGERARADGWGPLLGDRGSGYAIGEAALRAACLMADGCIAKTELLPQVLATLQVGSIDELVQRVYAPDFDKSRVAALFPIVLSGAAQGDGEADRILRQAGTELALTAASVLKRLQIERVAVTGGVISRQSPVREGFEAALHMHLPNAQVHEPRFDAAIGAALLAV
jgi:N-acetylglucosamine kinase-like BadF-type ATPase